MMHTPFWDEKSRRCGYDCVRFVGVIESDLSGENRAQLQVVDALAQKAKVRVNIVYELPGNVAAM